MDDRSIAYKLKVVVDITCSPGGGLEIHYMDIELPKGTVLEAGKPLKVNCWPKLSDHILVNEEQRLIEIAPQGLPGFTLPPPESTLAPGSDIGNIAAGYQDTVFDVSWYPRTGEEAGTIETPVIGEVDRLLCLDGAPPIAVADPFGNITYMCRDGSKPYSAKQSFFSTEGSPVGLPHTDESSTVRFVDEPRVFVTASEYWSNIPLLAIGCCANGTVGPTVDPTGTGTSTVTSTATGPVTSTVTADPTATTPAPTTAAPTSTPTADASTSAPE